MHLAVADPDSEEPEWYTLLITIGGIRCSMKGPFKNDWRIGFKCTLREMYYLSAGEYDARIYVRHWEHWGFIGPDETVSKIVIPLVIDSI